MKEPDGTVKGNSVDWANVGYGLLGFVIVLLVLAIVGAIGFWVVFVDFVDNYQVAYKFDARTGAITVLEGHGYFVTPPVVVKVHHVDLRPMQVCINANRRVLNCKLVQFNPEGLKLFLSWHGRNDYEVGSSGNFDQILLSYAYDGSGKNYPFLTVLRELKNQEKQ